MSVGRGIGSEVDGDPELEIWDWNADMDSVIVSDESALDLAEADRLHQWKLLGSRQFYGERVSSSSLWLARQQQLDVATSRTSSILQDTHHRLRGIDSDSGLQVDIPRHHKCIPSLSLIASLLFVDRSTISMLNHPEHDLFPLYSYEHPSEEHDGMPHGATKLLADSDAKTTLREGLTVACDPEITPFNPFALPSLGLSGLWSLVNGVWINGGRVVREVWT